MIDTLPRVFADAITSVVSSVTVDVLTDVSVNMVSAVIKRFGVYHINIIRMITLLLSSVCLLVDDYPGLCPRFAGLDTLVPRVIKVCVTSTSAVFEPRTTVSATTSFARFLDDAALGAYGTADRRSDGWCLHVDACQHDKGENAII